MKKFVVTCAAFISLALSPAANASDQSALQAVKLEPKVKDAIITNSHVLYAGVWTDGTNRNGYAMYLCEVLREHKSSAKRVKVVDMATVLKNDNVFKWKVLGGIRC